MKFIHPLLLAIVVLGLIGAGIWFYLYGVTSTATSNVYSQIVTVQKGALSNTISVVGELDAVQSADLAFTHMSSSAKLLTLNVAAGNIVTKGQVLARIDAAPYQQALDQAQSDLKASQKALADLQAPPTAVGIAQANLAIAQAQYDQQKAQQDFADLQAPNLTDLQNAVQDAQDALTQLGLNGILAERDSLAKSARDLAYTVDWYQRRIATLTSLKKKNLEQTQELSDDQQKLAQTQADLAQVRAQIELARASSAAAKAKDQVALAAAQTALAQAQAGGDKVALANAQLAVQSANVALAKAQSDRTQLDAGADAAQLAADQADVDKKQLAVNDAQAALAGTQLVADFDGTVLQTNVNPGDQVSASTIVLTVANLKDLEVLASIDETTIKRVVVGQTARISFDAFPGQNFQGKVLSVPLQGSLQNQVMVYQVPLSLEGAESLALKVGMTANVAIQTAQVSDALLVPTIALQRVNGEYQVLTPNRDDPKGAPVPVTVQVGLSDGTYTQITQGLKVGDQVTIQIQAATNSSNNNSRNGGIITIQGGGNLPGGGRAPSRGNGP